MGTSSPLTLLCAVMYHARSVDTKLQHDLSLIADQVARAVDASMAASPDHSLDRHLTLVAERHAVVRHVVTRSHARGRAVGVVVLLTSTDDAVLAQGAANAGLSPRETAVAIRVSHGERNADIARALGISVNTVRHHVERILAKLGLRSRHQVARRLMRAAIPGQDGRS
jgi:DNA-binding NarL/FixJ family response regulator